MLKSSIHLLFKALLMGALGSVAFHSAFAQMDHSSHMMSATPAKPLTSTGSGLD
jgi:hypothetical protein